MVAYPLAREFNETVALDLHELDSNLYYTHFIDHFTRLSGAAIIRSKDPGIVLNKFLQHWVSLYGSLRKILSDNGGEFNNEQFRDMTESFNIRVTTTAAEIPCSNGLCESHSATLTEILLTIKEESACDLNTVLSWATMAKNCLHNVKRNNSDKWKGPGRVTDQDGQQAFVRHDGTYVRIHPCCLMKCSDADNSAARIWQSRKQLGKTLKRM